MNKKKEGVIMSIINKAKVKTKLLLHAFEVEYESKPGKRKLEFIRTVEHTLDCGTAIDAIIALTERGDTEEKRNRYKKEYDFMKSIEPTIDKVVNNKKLDAGNDMLIEEAYDLYNETEKIYKTAFDATMKMRKEAKEKKAN